MSNNKVNAYGNQDIMLDELETGDLFRTITGDFYIKVSGENDDYYNACNLETGELICLCLDIFVFPLKSVEIEEADL